MSGSMFHAYNNAYVIYNSESFMNFQILFSSRHLFGILPFSFFIIQSITYVQS